VSVPNAGPVDELVRLAVDVDAAGWDGFFVWDHLQLFRDMDLELHDPWVLLGAVAQATTRVRLGTMVTPLSRRRPWKLAKEVTTLDHLSGGRAVLGIGLGFPPDDEFTAFGEDASLAGRARRTDEGLDLLDDLLRAGPVVHHGAAYDVDAHLRPDPVQAPRPPIWVGATAPHRPPLARAARWDGVFPIGGDGMPMPPSELKRYVGDLAGRAGFELVSGRHPDHSVEAYADVGVTWLVDSTWPDPGWLGDLRAQVLGPVDG
jgi:alkanesulfonate monooxygenase SsuD/methylene tetrahydromethanopterin reductase-like flavin-dependent oxidoreductase (luciferase family)